MSNLFKLNMQDLMKGLVVAVIAVVLGAVQQMVTAHGMDFAAYDWNSIVTIAGTAAISYLGKNLFSDSSGAVLGRFGGVYH